VKCDTSARPGEQLGKEETTKTAVYLPSFQILYNLYFKKCQIQVRSSRLFLGKRLRFASPVPKGSMPRLFEIRPISDWSNFCQCQGKPQPNDSSKLAQITTPQRRLIAEYIYADTPVQQKAIIMSCYPEAFIINIINPLLCLMSLLTPASGFCILDRCLAQFI
jgi:hypothetical protein